MKRIVVFFLLVVLFAAGNRLAAQSRTGGSGQNTKPRSAVLNHLAIYVVNLQKTVNFYSNIFQLDTIPEPFHDNKHAWYSIAPGVALHVIAGSEKPKEYFLNNHMCFSVASVDDFVQKIKAQNIPWVNAKGEPGQVTTRVDGVKQVWVNDPDGYFIEVNDAKN